MVSLNRNCFVNLWAFDVENCIDYVLTIKIVVHFFLDAQYFKYFGIKFNP
jgi:hypothetical protein